MRRKGKPIIRVNQLVKNYKIGKVVTKALRGISFEVYKGEFVGIMGPSGSGKSTTMHQLGLLDFPTGGKIVIDGIDVTRMREKQRSVFRLKKLGFVFQQYKLIPELNALENVFLPLRMMGLPKQQCIVQAKILLEKVGLGERIYHHSYELSGGEQQRVTLARAMIHKPDILFADEPTASLDTSSGKLILDLLTSLNKKGQTIVMVSHESEHKKYFDRIIHLRDGLVE